MAAIPIGIGFALASRGPLAVLGHIAAGATIAALAKNLAEGMKDEESDAKKEDKENDDAKAPGKPTEDDGFEEPKKDTGMKVPPGGRKKGWPDKKGNIWVPTGPGSGDGSRQPHGGPHWDVVGPDGSHRNVYPGGRVRY
ncbi:hypothetical protein TWF281_002619 [Arthrobotrys megalospora]